MLALTPGLALATTPSLLWVLADPVSLRAALLGATCLALLLAGARRRWSSPLVVGAVVGGLMVLRELAPYAAVTPQWILIGAAGTLLTVVGSPGSGGCATCSSGWRTWAGCANAEPRLFRVFDSASAVRVPLPGCYSPPAGYVRA